MHLNLKGIDKRIKVVARRELVLHYTVREKMDYLVGKKIIAVKSSITKMFLMFGM